MLGGLLFLLVLNPFLVLNGARFKGFNMSSVLKVRQSSTKLKLSALVKEMEKFSQRFHILGTLRKTLEEKIQQLKNCSCAPDTSLTDQMTLLGDYVKTMSAKIEDLENLGNVTKDVDNLRREFEEENARQQIEQKSSEDNLFSTDSQVQILKDQMSTLQVNQESNVRSMTNTMTNITVDLVSLRRKMDIQTNRQDLERLRVDSINETVSTLHGHLGNVIDIRTLQSFNGDAMKGIHSNVSRLQESHELMAENVTALHRLVSSLQKRLDKTLSEAQGSNSGSSIVYSSDSNLESSYVGTAAKNENSNENNEIPNTKNANTDANNETPDINNGNPDAKNKPYAKNENLDANNEDLDAEKENQDAKNEKQDAKNENPNTKNANTDANSERFNETNETTDTNNRSANANNNKPDAKNENLDTKNENQDAKKVTPDAKNENLDAKNENLDAKNENPDANIERQDRKNEQTDTKNENLYATNENPDAKNENSNSKNEISDAKNEKTYTNTKKPDVKNENLDANNENMDENNERVDAKNENPDVKNETPETKKENLHAKNEIPAATEGNEVKDYCPEVPEFSNAVSAGKTRAKGANITYTCMDNHVMCGGTGTSSFSLTCEESGDWSEVDFRCERSHWTTMPAAIDDHISLPVPCGFDVGFSVTVVGVPTYSELNLDIVDDFEEIPIHVKGWVKSIFHSPIMNSFMDGAWGKEKRSWIPNPLRKNRRFEITLKHNKDHVQLKINNKSFLTFPYEGDDLTTLTIGHIKVSEVTFQN